MKTVDIIGEVVADIDLTFKAKGIVDNGDGSFTLTTCDTLWLQENFPLTIDGVAYKIKTIIEDVSIIVTGSVIPGLTEFNIYPPHYFHGTVIKTKNEMEIAKRKGEGFQTAILPFVYLKEILKDKNNRKGSGEMYEKESDLQIFFLTYSNFNDWSTVDHYEKSIDPIHKLVKAFIVSAEKHLLVGSFEQEPDETINHVNFGVNTTNGHSKSIFVEQLSGVEMNITMPFFAEPCKICN